MRIGAGKDWLPSGAIRVPPGFQRRQKLLARHQRAGEPHRHRPERQIASGDHARCQRAAPGDAAEKVGRPRCRHRKRRDRPRVDCRFGFRLHGFGNQRAGRCGPSIRPREPDGRLPCVPRIHFQMGDDLKQPGDQSLRAGVIGQRFRRCSLRLSRVRCIGLRRRFAPQMELPIIESGVKDDHRSHLRT